MNNQTLKDLLELELYFIKKNSNYSSRINKLIVSANQQSIPTPNEVAKDFGRKENALLTLAETNNLSDIEVPVGARKVYRGTKLDDLSGGNSLVLFSREQPQNFTTVVEASSRFPGKSKYEKVSNFLRQKRKKESVGGYDIWLQELFGMASGAMSDDSLTSEHMIDKLYIVPESYEVIMTEKFNLDGGVSYSDVIDLTTDLASLALTFGAMALTGGSSVLAQASVKMYTLANKPILLVNIANNIYDKNYLQAALGIAAFILNVSTKTLAVFYKTYIAGPNQIIIHAPAHFAYLLELIVSTFSFAVEEGLDILDDMISSWLKEKFGTKNLDEKQLAELRINSDPMAKIAAAYVRHGGIPRDARVGMTSVANKFRQKIPHKK